MRSPASSAGDRSTRDEVGRPRVPSANDVSQRSTNGRLIFGIFAALAEFERELIRERTRAGIRAARRRGRHIGRPRRLSQDQLDHARALIASGKGKGNVAALFGVHVATLRRALNELVERG